MKFIKRSVQFLSDKNGNFTIIQPANPPLVIWLVCFLVGKIFSSGLANKSAEIIGFGALFTWAYLEITTGDSAFRRLLGIIVMIIIISSRI